MQRKLRNRSCPLLSGPRALQRSTKTIPWVESFETCKQRPNTSSWGRLITRPWGSFCSTGRCRPFLETGDIVETAPEPQLSSSVAFGDRSLFPSLRVRAFLNHAAVSPPSALVLTAIQQYLQDVAAHGSGAWSRWSQQRERLRSKLGWLLGRRRSTGYVHQRSPRRCRPDARLEGGTTGAVFSW